MKKVLGAIGAVLVVILIVTISWFIWVYQDNKHLRTKQKIANLKARGYHETVDADKSVKFVKVLSDGTIKTVRVAGATPTTTLATAGPQAGATSTAASTPAVQPVSPSSTTASTTTPPSPNAATNTSVSKTEASPGTPPPTTTTNLSSTLSAIPKCSIKVKEIKNGSNGKKARVEYKTKIRVQEPSGKTSTIKLKVRKSRIEGKTKITKCKLEKLTSSEKASKASIRAFPSHTAPTTTTTTLPSTALKGQVAYKMKISASSSQGKAIKENISGQVSSDKPNSIHHGVLAKADSTLKRHPVIEYRLRVKYYGLKQCPMHAKPGHKGKKYRKVVKVWHLSKQSSKATHRAIPPLIHGSGKSIKKSPSPRSQPIVAPSRGPFIMRDAHTTKICKCHSKVVKGLPSRSQVNFLKTYLKPHKWKRHLKLKIVIYQHHYHDLFGHKHKVETHHWDDTKKSGVRTIKVKRHLIRTNREYKPLVEQLPEDQAFVKTSSKQKLVIPPHVYHQNYHFFQGFKDIRPMANRIYGHHKYQCWNNVPQEVAFDPKYYGHHHNVIIELPRDDQGKPVQVTDQTRVIFCVRSK